MFFKRCLIVFLIALASDMIACLHIKTLIDNSIAMAAGTVFVLHIMSFFSHHWFVDYKEAYQRFLITLASAVGAGLGTVFVVLFSR